MLKIGVLGGGNGAFITAADLTLRGFNVNIYEVPKFEKNITLAKKRQEIKLEIKGNPGLKGGIAKLNKVTTDIKEAIEDRDVIFVIVPAFAQKVFAEIGADFFNPNQLVVLEPGNFGGSIEFANILIDKGVKILPNLVESECMIYSGFKNDSGSVWVSGYKDGMKIAAYPGKFTNKALAILKEIYPKLERTNNILETGLSNINTVVHAPILALNAGWAEQPEMEFLFYWQGCTEAVGRVVESIEKERIKIGKAIGVDLTYSRDTLINWYGHQGAGGNNVAEVLRTNPAFKWDYAPNTMKHRFFMEDIPYGMIPMEEVGKLVGVKTPIITGIIDIGSLLANENFRAIARNFEKLGLQGLNKEKLLEKMYTGGEDQAFFAE